MKLTWAAPLAFIGIMLGGGGVAQLSGEWVTTGGGGPGVGGGAGQGQGGGAGQGEGGGTEGGSGTEGDSGTGEGSGTGQGDGVGGGTGEGTGGGGGRVIDGPLTPDDLKGWMTLGQAADGLGVTVEELVSLIDADTALAADTAFRDVESLVPGFELSEFREVVREFLASGG